MVSKFKKTCGYVVVSSIFGFSANAAQTDYFDLSLEELMEIEVTTASKTEEKAFDSASAVYVITSEDIKRSGSTSIPEALRLAPGVNVARIDSNKWAISVRGFNHQYSNQLLVLFDGRSVYTPLFSGVWWDSQDYVLEDIDRIEVVRGPGGSLWGANAVNGVINIISKKAKDTQGVYASATAGNKEHFIGEARYGGKIDDSYYRVYAKRLDRDQEKLASNGIGSNDDWYMNRSGFKVDTEKEKSNLTVQGDFFSGAIDHTVSLPQSTEMTKLDNEEMMGANIITKYNYKFSEDNKIEWQFYADFEQRNNLVLNQERFTYDISMQHSIKPNSRNNLIYGFEYRNIRDDLKGKTIAGGTDYISFSPSKKMYDITSAFIQNKTEILKNKLYLTLGSKFDYNDFTHYEYQPTARLSYKPKENHHFWSAVSRAIRAPSRVDDAAVIKTLYDTGVYVGSRGNEQFDSEDMVSYEVGYRYKKGSVFSFDTTAFVNKYDNLYTLSSAGVVGDSLLYDERNDGDAEVYGVELSSSYAPSERWRLSASYSVLKADFDYLTSDAVASSSFYAVEESAPNHSFNVRSYYNFTPKVQLDNVLIYNDNLSSSDVPAYIRFDTRVAYKYDKNWEYSLVGQNLTDSYHQEFSAALYSKPIEIGRSVYFNVKYSY